MAQVNFRIDDNLKTKAENACSAMGLTLSSAVTIFLTKVANENRIPFEISADSFYSKENMEVLKRRIADAKEGHNMHEHELIEVD